MISKNILYVLCAGALFFSTILFSCSQHHTTIDPRMSGEIIHMPNSIQPMGVVGLHALVDFTPWVYGGAALYSAVSGEKGGYFALAVESGIQHPLFKKISWDGGVRIGGGGGHNTPVGGGLLIEPYFGINYRFDHFKTGLYYSYIYFNTGKIASDQVGVELSVPFHFHYVTTTVDDSSSCQDCLFQQLTHADNYVAALSKTYFPEHQVVNTHNQRMRAAIEFLGVEIGHFISRTVFLFFNFSGAMHGNDNGYADELIGAGYRMPLFHSSAWSGVIKIGAGSGGGGAVNTGGGFIYHPAAGIEYRFNPYASLELNGGYIAAPEGNFKSTEASITLKYYFSHLKSSQDNSESHLNAWRVRVLNQTYFKPQSNTGGINPTMQLLGMNVDYFPWHYFYCTGQTAFAYQGKSTGGYFSGMLGIGAETPALTKKRIYLFSEILSGTAGGAGLSIGDGALVEPVAGLGYQLNDAVALQISAGYLLALQGHFHPMTINAGLSYKLWQ